jgi:phosphoenolpyruvate-protein kinase (PTS system EI component)
VAPSATRVSALGARRCTTRCILPCWSWVRATALAAQRAGISVAVCGQLASDPFGALVLVGLGVGELSMEPASIDGTRYALHSHSSEELRELAKRALTAETAAQVRAMA